MNTVIWTIVGFIFGFVLGRKALYRYIHGEMQKLIDHFLGKEEGKK